MKTKAKWLSLAILNVYILMCLPWAQKILWAAENGGYYVEYYWMSYILGLFSGNPFGTLSSLMALAALIVSMIGAFGKGCHPVACGILLLLSAASGLAMGFVFGFRWFTILTYIIIAALIGLGFFALFGFRRKQAKTEA